MVVTPIFVNEPDTGAVVNYGDYLLLEFAVSSRLTRFSVVVMVSVVDAQRDILLDPIGSNVWSGQAIQTANSSAIT